MAKKYPEGYIKDEKKVLAGKARAAKSLRINGRFTTNIFLEQVTRDAETAGTKNVMAYYRQHESVYTKLYEKEMLTTRKNQQQIEIMVDEFTGITLKNYKQVKKETIYYSMANTNQYLRNEFNVVYWEATTYISLNGKLNVMIPSPAMIKKEIGEDVDQEEFIELMNEIFLMTVIIS